MGVMLWVSVGCPDSKLGMTNVSLLNIERPSRLFFPTSICLETWMPSSAEKLKIEHSASLAKRSDIGPAGINGYVRMYNNNDNDMPDWKTHPFHKPVKSRRHASIKAEGPGKLVHGSLPLEMDDKSFVYEYADGPDAQGHANSHLHRSWTEHKIVEVTMTVD